MKIKLDMEDVRFATTACEEVGEIRWMVVNIGQKKIVVRRQMNSYAFFHDEKRYREEIDKTLVNEMESLLTKVVNDACGALPEGVELLNKE